ncbi:MAG TPA: di-heme oxidoredictase family protein, partial [Polyangiales bacterium]|nr:di-heme oxidoredictase family protein [Polyangiales bacterium]
SPSAGTGAPAQPTAADDPPSSCEERLPSTFATECAGCHDLGGNDARYPNLTAFTGTEAQLIDRVRSGGRGMPAFDATQLSDAALRDIYTALRKRATGMPRVSLGRATPLFEMASDIAPISFMRDDGVLITRGAGRVRGRHELEGTYSPFGPLYFEDRTYGFLIEDYTPRGESRLRVTYLPVARPQDSTNFRCFKIYGNGNVFSANTGMDSDVPLPSLRSGGEDYGADYARNIAAYARIQAHEVTRNARTNAPLRQGDMFEFEFGIFIEPSEVAQNGRTAYYTDTFRYRVGSGGLTPENFDTSGQPGPSSVALQGGATTLAWLYAEPELYFSQMALNIQHENVQHFVEGRRLFHTDFASGKHSESGNPDLPEQAHKAGPLFVTTSCENCHVRNGGGRPLTAALDEKSSLVFKLYGPDEAPGSQLQLQEGSARLLDSEKKNVTLADGSVVELSRPRYEVIVDKAAAPRYSARVARRLLGLGLLEAIDERALLVRADPNDCDGDGISGRANVVMDPSGTGAHLGRFGWRAEKVSVEHQVADALAADLGVQTRVFKGQNAEVELSDADLGRLTTYMRLLGVPPRRDVTEPAVAQGEVLFRSVGCAKCHVPSVTTGRSHPFVELRDQQIQPYSDLLLHDLGADLSDAGGQARDGTGDDPPTASEWRTAPLWGVGLSAKVQGYVALLHDGRAKSVLEAVLWHGGEATSVRERVTQLRREDREALIRFVESL